MTSNKQNLDLYLPSLINNHKFQSIIYHHNKLIVYDSSSSNKQAPISPKAIEILERPKTSASLSNKLSNRLVHARSKASIDKFISTQKRIQQQRKKNQTNYLPNKSFHKKLINKTSVSKLQTIITQDQSVKREQPLIAQKTKVQTINLPFPNYSNEKVQISEPSEKLINEIIQKTHISSRNSVRISVRDNKSIETQSRQSINLKNPDLNYINQLSQSRQNALQNKAKNTQTLRKSITLNSKETQKSKTNLSSFSNFPTKAKKKKVQNKQQQEINEQNLICSELNLEQNSDPESIKNLSDRNEECIKNLFNPIYALYGSKDLFKREQLCDKNLEGLQIVGQYGVLPLECFFSAQTEKRKSYIDNRINHLQRKLHQQQNIIKNQDEQIHQLKDQKHRLFAKDDSNSIKDSQISKLQHKSEQKPNLNLKSIKLSSINSQNQHSSDEDLKKEQILKQEIESLNRRTMQNQHLLQNHSKYTTLNIANQHQNPSFFTDSVSNHFQIPKLSTQPRKLVLSSRMKQKSNLVQIQQNYLKRAQIVKSLQKKYFESVKGLYWLLINQKENAFLINKKQTDSQSNSQSLKYIKHFHQNRSQIFDESSLEYAQNKNQEKIFIDKEFLHQTIQSSHMKQDTHWLYFKPCTQSSIFPSQLRLPQHYIITQSTQSSINGLVSLLNCILNLNPILIERLFEPTYNNVFSCWLNKNGHFQPTHVDGYLPYNGQLSSYFAWTEEFLWIGILLKCCAKLFGGYDQLFNLKFDDWSQVILGRTLTKLQKPSYKEIKNWQEDEFEQKVIEYLAKCQQKHKSTLVVRSKQTEILFLITAIKKNKIKLSQIHSQTKKLQISLFEFIIDENYELVLFPESPNSFYKTSYFQSYAKGNIVTYQLKIQENKSIVTICTQLSSEEQVQLSFSRKKKQPQEKRRVLIYEIPHFGKRENKQKQQMVLKYSSDTHTSTRVFKNHQGVDILQIDLPQIKKGEYKIFIECGKIKLNDYFESHSKTITKRLRTEESYHEKISPKNSSNIQNGQNENKTFKNVLSVISSHPVELKGGSSLIVNEKSIENEVIEDENFIYKQARTNQKEDDEQLI